MCRWFFEEQLGDIVRCRNACRASTNWKLSTKEKKPIHTQTLYLSIPFSHTLSLTHRKRERERERNDLKKAKELKLKRTHIEFWLIFKDRLSQPKPKTEIRVSLISVNYSNSRRVFESVWTHLAKFCHFGKNVKVFGQFFGWPILFLANFWNNFGILSLLYLTGQRLNSNIAIWSHCLYLGVSYLLFSLSKRSSDFLGNLILWTLNSGKRRFLDSSPSDVAGIAADVFGDPTRNIYSLPKSAKTLCATFWKLLHWKILRLRQLNLKTF